MASKEVLHDCPICDEICVEKHIENLFKAVVVKEWLPFTQIQQTNGEINPKTKCGCTPLHVAAMFGHVQFCEFFLVNSEEKNPANDLGVTPLHIAACKGQVTICKVMVKFIIDKSPRDKRGFTPLHEAATWGHLDICKLLVKKSKNPNPKCNRGMAPLHCATASLLLLQH